MQREFRKAAVPAACLLLAAAIVSLGAAVHRLPNRTELGHREAPLRFDPVQLATGQVGPFPIVGAWRLRVDDPRFGGISGLAVDQGDLLAISDSGVVARFPKPGSPDPIIALDQLPGGPGDPGFKYNRDSEALAADPTGRGWWVAFENRNAVWLYDQQFRRVVERRSIAATGLGRNRGVEGMVADKTGMLLFPERGHLAVRPDGGTVSILGLSGWISDVVRLAGGRLLVANRTPSPFGLSNRLVLLTPRRTGWQATASWPIPVGRLDNVEALAVEPQPDGALRLWMMTDNSLQQRRPTLLIALELRPRPAR